MVWRTLKLALSHLKLPYSPPLRFPLLLYLTQVMVMERLFSWSPLQSLSKSSFSLEQHPFGHERWRNDLFITCFHYSSSSLCFGLLVWTVQLSEVTAILNVAPKIFFVSYHYGEYTSLRWLKSLTMVTTSIPHNWLKFILLTSSVLHAFPLSLHSKCWFMHRTCKHAEWPQRSYFGAL